MKIPTYQCDECGVKYNGKRDGFEVSPNTFVDLCTECVDKARSALKSRVQPTHLSTLSNHQLVALIFKLFEEDFKTL